MKTSAQVTFGLYNLAMRLGAALAYDGGLQSFSKIDDLKTGNVSGFPYATLEPDFWVLDGRYKLRSTTDSLVHVGLMSMTQSGADGAFADPPTLTVTFSELQSSDGLVLRFSPMSGDYADDIQLTYYNLSGEVLHQGAYTPDSGEYEIDLVVNHFTRLEIQFNATNKPYRYLRLTGLDYGQLIRFSGGEIRQLSVVEEIDPLSLRIPANACDVRIYSEDDLFSIFNDNDYYSRLSQRQPLSVYGIVDDAQIFMGQYYLDAWKYAGAKNTEFSCVDLVGILEHIPYRGGMFDGELAGDVIAAMLDAAAMPYDIDEDLYNTPLRGWIPYGTLREGLQQIAFVIGAVVDSSRSYVLRVQKSTLAVYSAEALDLPYAIQMMKSTAELKPSVTAIELTAHAYTEGTESETIFDGTLASGRTEIKFSKPFHSLTVEGATLAESGVNYAIIEASAPDTPVVVSGLGYTDSARTMRVAAETGLYAYENVIRIEDATLVTPEGGAALAQRVFDYYQMRYLQKTKVYGESYQTGQTVLSEVTIAAQKIQGTIEKMSVNLTGGFACAMEITGAKA